MDAKSSIEKKAKIGLSKQMLFALLMNFLKFFFIFVVFAIAVVLSLYVINYITDSWANKEIENKLTNIKSELTFNDQKIQNLIKGNTDYSSFMVPNKENDYLYSRWTPYIRRDLETRWNYDYFDRLGVFNNELNTIRKLEQDNDLNLNFITNTIEKYRDVSVKRH